MVSQKDLLLIRWVVSYAKPYWRKAVLCIIAVTFAAVLEPVLPALMQPLIDKSLIGKVPSAIWQIPLWIILAFLAKGIAEYTANVASQSLAQQTVSGLRRAIFEHQLDLPIAEHHTTGSGAMLSKITYDSGLISDVISSAWLIILRDSLILFGLVGFLFYTAWQLALVVLLVAPLVVYVIRRTSIRLRCSNRSLQELVGRFNSVISESFQGLAVIKIFGAQRERSRKFDYLNQALRIEQMRIIRSQALNVPLVQVIAACAISVVILLASMLSAQDLLTPGEFVAFITGMAMVFEPIRRLTNVNSVLQRGLSAAEVLRQLLERPTEEIKDNSRTGAEGVRAITPVRGSIEFRNVSFSYPGQSNPILRNFNLLVHPGETVIVRGESGVGKSTIFNLIVSFYKVDSGRILIDGIDLSNWDLRVLRSNVSLVSQHSTLFSGTVRDNMLMAQPRARDSEIWEALKVGGIDAYFHAQPLGLDTLIYESGQQLSGGQRQRLSISRAVLRNASILLLDEPTSAVDSETEAFVVSALEEHFQERTKIVITHSQKFTLAAARTVLISGPDTVAS